nr:GAF domain-containing protein [uncultured Sphaerochaeta sp.]
MHIATDSSFLEQLTAIIEGWDGSAERRYCHLSNVSALLNQQLENINWVGFYLMREDRKSLVLGPFQGKVACTDIDLDRGVCGLSARKKASVRVDDVHTFPSHIACDSASMSELVVPLISKSGDVVGVLDVDSAQKGRFSVDDQKLLERVSKIISEALWT